MYAAPHLALGQSFHGLIVKPLDRYDVFHPVVTLNGNQTQGFCGRNYKFFPTQVCISIIATPNGGQRVVDALVEGLDQFGFPASEIVRITANADSDARVGTKRCYAAIFTLRKIAQQGTEIGDRYSVGIGRTLGDAATPPAGTDGAFRVPLLGRLRSSDGFVGLQSLDDGVFIHHTAGFQLDLANQAIEFILPDVNPRFLVQMLSPRVANVVWTNQ